MSEPLLPCDRELLRRCLDGELSRQEHEALEIHLDQCEECCQRLHDSSADHAWWKKPAEFLRSDAFDYQMATKVHQSVVEKTEWERPTHDGLRRVLELLAPSDDPHRLGRWGRYEVVGAIGFGGMAVVLKGFESTLNRFVAIKVLAPHLAHSATARDRFSREARAAASVLHPNVIAIHSVAEFKGIPYLVMPYIAGGSLQDRIDRDGPLSVESTVRIAMQIAAGLAAAHAQGLVHRDIKPANILLEPGLERVVITDFGLARAADDASITQTGMLAGTPHYMSPEQAKGDRLDHQSDLFSFGSLLFTMATGQVPFSAETSYGVLRRITDQPAPKLRDVDPHLPRWLCTLTSRLHAREPHNRYLEADEVSKLLSQCLASLQHSSHPIPASLRPNPLMECWQWTMRRVVFAVTDGRRLSPRQHIGLGMFSIAAIVLIGLGISRWTIGNPRTITIPEEVGSNIAWPEDGKWATLTGRFMLEGDLPPPKTIVPTRDSQVYTERLPDETLLVHQQNGGVANLFVWLEESPDLRRHPQLDTAPNAVFQARYIGGRIEPHAFLLRGAQTLSIVNRDPVDHNVKVGEFLQKYVIPTGEHVSREFTTTDEGPVAISCEFHPWARSYFLVQEHPYMAVTDENGAFRIEKVPSGRWRVHIWHESSGAVERVVSSQGQIQHWPGGMREINFDRPLVELGDLVPELK